MHLISPIVDIHLQLIHIFQANCCLLAVQGQPKSSDLRVPTSSWSGYGFSQSSPSAVLKEQKQREANTMSQVKRGTVSRLFFGALA